MRRITSGLLKRRTDSIRRIDLRRTRSQILEKYAAHIKDNSCPAPFLRAAEERHPLLCLGIRRSLGIEDSQTK